jgi:hypothetical protein
MREYSLLRKTRRVAPRDPVDLATFGMVPDVGAACDSRFVGRDMRGCSPGCGWICTSISLLAFLCGCKDKDESGRTQAASGAAARAESARDPKRIPPCDQIVSLRQLQHFAGKRLGLNVDLFPDTNTAWKNHTIGVCWENPTTQNEHGRALTRQAVQATWEAESAVRFVGWKECDSNFEGIHIQVMSTEDGDHTDGLGNELLDPSVKMVLDFTFTNWTPKCPPGSDTDGCIKFLAIHEFGHALGFAHEQNRDDAPPECKRVQDQRKGTCTFCPIDLTSVMSYCRSNWKGSGFLSNCDKSSVKSLYAEESNP